MRLIIILLILLVTVAGVNAYGSYTQDELNNTFTEYNITFDASPSSEFVYITIPRRVNITSAELNLTGHTYDIQIQDAEYNYTATPYGNLPYVSVSYEGVGTVEGFNEVFDAQFAMCQGTSNHTGYCIFTVNYSIPDIMLDLFKPENMSHRVRYIEDCHSGTCSAVSTRNWTSYIFNWSSKGWIELGTYGSIGNVDENNEFFNFNYTFTDSVYNNLIQSSNITIMINMTVNETEAAAAIRRNRIGVKEEYIYLYYNEGSPENITVDTGNDGSNDYTNDTVFITSQTIDLNVTAINDYLHVTCTADWMTGSCDVPFNITSVHTGVLEISGINLVGEYLDDVSVCDGVYDEEVIYFHFYDEASLTSTNASSEFAIEGTSFSLNSSVTNTPNFTICTLGNSTYTVDMTLIYSNSTADQRTYYLYQADLSSSSSQNISLYTIPSAVSGKVNVIVKDANDQAVENAYVNIQRYYVDENEYRTVAIGKTDSNGGFLTYVYLDDVFFKFITSIAGVVSNTVGPQVIIDTTDDPESLILYTTTTSTQYWEIRENVGANCYVNYTTNYTICTITDASGLITSARLLVTQFDLATQPVICDTSGSGSAFTLSCFMGVDANGTYTYKLITTPDPNPSYTLITGTASFPTTSIFGDHGLFPTFLLMLTIALAFAANPAIGAILAVLGLGAAMAFEFIAIGPVSLVSLMAVAMLIFIKRRGA